MSDADGPQMAKIFYEQLFQKDAVNISPDDVPYALDYAASELRNGGAPPERWATFIHLGA
jgi:hypothetical protein